MPPKRFTAVKARKPSDAPPEGGMHWSAVLVLCAISFIAGGMFVMVRAKESKTELQSQVRQLVRANLQERGITAEKCRGNDLPAAEQVQVKVEQEDQNQKADAETEPVQDVQPKPKVEPLEERKPGEQVKFEDADEAQDQQKVEPKAEPVAVVVDETHHQNDEKNREPVEPSKHRTEETAVPSIAVEAPPGVIAVIGRDETEWSSELYERQLKLLMQQEDSPTSTGSQRFLDEKRPKGPTARDEGIRPQLVAAKLCSSIPRPAEWDRKTLLTAFSTFYPLYKNRPIQTNRHGMRVSHAFACWFVVKSLQPKFIIENGVNRGQSTWLLRQAAPNAKIISLDPVSAAIQHWDANVTYFVGKNYSKPGFVVHDFQDFEDIDWDAMVEKENTLILWDDHQDEFTRLQLMRKLGFKRAMYDDNWAPLLGDNYSIKQVCDETGGMMLKPPDAEPVVHIINDFGRTHFNITIEKHQANRQFALESLEEYMEFPPVLWYPSLWNYMGHHYSQFRGLKGELTKKLLEYMTEALVPLPLIQSQAELDAIGFKLNGFAEFQFYSFFGYVKLKDHR